MRKQALVALLAGLVVAACSAGASASSNSQDLGQIRAIEGQFHEALTHKDLQLMMSLWTTDATFTTGGHTYTGSDQIRTYFATTNAAFKPQNDWIVLTSGWRITASVSGHDGTVRFECYFLDVPTKTLKAASAADATVTKRSGHWLIRTFTSKPFSVSAAS